MSIRTARRKNRHLYESMFTHVSTLANSKHQQSVTKLHNDTKQDTFHLIMSSITLLPGCIWPMFTLT